MNKNPRDIKVEILEHPGYYIDGTGLICYKKGNGFFYCKKADKQSAFILQNGKQITISESEFADKYVPGWRQYRKSISEQTPTLDSLHNYLKKVIETNADLKQKLKWINEYTNKLLNITNPPPTNEPKHKVKTKPTNSVIKLDKRRKPNTWKGEFDNSKIELPLLPKIKSDIKKQFEKNKIEQTKELLKRGYTEKEIKEFEPYINRESNFLATADKWEEMLEKYGFEKANELWKNS